jgi:hypothetical protein
MADFAIRNEPRVVARVDRLIDENAAPLELGKDTALHQTGDTEAAVGGTGPAAWWRRGLIALGIVAAILLLFQVLMGGAGTDMVPGTPTVAPAETTQLQQ